MRNDNGDAIARKFAVGLLEHLGFGAGTDGGGRLVEHQNVSGSLLAREGACQRDFSAGIGRPTARAHP